MKVGTRVSWNSSGGTARGIIRQIIREGNVPDIPVKVTGSEEEPAARIEIVDDEGKPTGEMVGHKLSTLRKNENVEEDVQKAEYQGEKVTLNKPRRIQGGNKKFEVFVMDGDKVKRVAFGDPNMEIRRDDPQARANFRSRHSCDTATDKTSARYWSCRMWEADTSVSEMTKEFEAYGEVTKVDDEQRIVYGFASVVSKNGEMVVDRQGDVITADEMEKAATKFMLGARNGLTMHKGEPTTTIVHSLPLTKQIMEAFGIASDKEGWLIAVKIHDDDTWDRMKKGEFTGFSIGGRARKVQLDD
jgi:hypothetical protein